jgi:glycosyltransferase involved in cell wall biosynthesis
VIEVSVIVTTKNEESNIGNCLKSIKQQTFPCDQIEIIVVDNNSTDRTKEIAKEYTDKIYNHGPERSAQRNLGVSKASGEYILYLDADMLLSKDVILESVKKCQEKGCVALYVSERIIGKGFWIRVRDFERSFYDATVIDCVRFVKKDKFLEIGGFDETLTGPEDWDFDRRIRQIGSVGIIEAPIYHNEGDFNLKKYLNKKVYYTQCFDKYIEKWGEDDSIIRKQLGFCYRFLGVFIEKGKWKKVIRHPWLILGAILTVLVRGLAWIFH